MRALEVEVIRLRAEECLSEEDSDSLAGQLLTEDAFTRLVQSDTDVYKPDGTLLLKFRKRVIPDSLTKLAFDTFWKAATPTDNRGMAAGPVLTQEDADKLAGRGKLVKANKGGNVRYRGVKQDGTVSNTNIAKVVNSGIVGFFDRNARFPYCRMTAFNIQHGQEFAKALPFIQRVDRCFAQEVPDRYASQKEAISKTSPDFYIPGTVFTTVTVNSNWQTAVHKDVGDLKAGFGVLTAVRTQGFDGCYLCFPRYRVAVDIGTGDVLLADVHEWHGNTPVKAVTKKYKRLSFVFYYREHMHVCGSADEEYERVKRRQLGDPLR